MSGFSAPWWFLLLAAAVAIGAGYVLAQRARRKRALRFANLAVLEQVAPVKAGWPRHVPAALLIAALIVLTFGLAGPTAEQRVPRERATVVLTIDVSLSMEATDVEPSRIDAAKAAAKSFAEGMPEGVNLGLVSFSGTATILVAPTTERAGLLHAIDNLTLAPSTGTGDGIFAALHAVENVNVVMGGEDGPPPAHIVLMTDGKQTTPTMDPYDARGAYTAAAVAADQDIPISTISFGTDFGTVRIEGRDIPVPVDDEAMAEIARIAGGRFHKAETAGELDHVYDSLGRQLGYEIVEADASRPWLAAGTLMLIGAAGTALLFGQRLP